MAKPASVYRYIRKCTFRHMLYAVGFLVILILFLFIYSAKRPLTGLSLILPVMLLILAGGILALSLIVFLFPRFSPTMIRLSGYGNERSLIREVEDELESNVLLESGPLRLTPKYLLEFGTVLVKIVPLESVLWVFDTQHMVYSPRLKRKRMVYSLWITTITGDRFILRDYRKAELAKITEVLTDRYPNFFYSYSEEHDRMVHYILEENRKELREKRRKG